MLSALAAWGVVWHAAVPAVHARAVGKRQTSSMCVAPVASISRAARTRAPAGGSPEPAANAASTLTGGKTVPTEPPRARCSRLERARWLIRRRQLGKAIGELGCHRSTRIAAPRALARIETPKRRLGRGIAVPKSRLASEPRADERSHDKLRPRGAVGAGARDPSGWRRLEPTRRGRE